MAGERHRILIVDPDEAAAQRVCAALRERYAPEVATTHEEALDILWQGRHSAAVIAADLGPAGGLDLLKRIRADGFNIPVVITSNGEAPPVPLEDLQKCDCQHLGNGERDLAFLPQMLSLLLEISEARYQNRLLNDVVENSADCILTTDPLGRIQSANHAVLPIFGYEPSELLNQPLAKLFPPELSGNDPEGLLQRTIEEGQWHGAFSGKRKDAGKVPVALSTFVIRNARRNPTHIICLAHDLTERTRLISRLERLAVTDEMTRLYNYRYFTERLGHEFRRAKRYGTPFACIILDLDYFKSVNDTYGHRAGDQVLQGVADVVSEATREVDVVTRYGGEEFAVLLPNTGREGAKACAEKIRVAVAGHAVLVGGIKIQVTCSLGVAAITPDMRDEETLLKRADTSLLIAKQRGRNCVCEWTEVTTFESDWQQDDDEARVARLRDRVRHLNLEVKPGYIEHAKPLVEQVEAAIVGAHSHSARVARHAGRLAAAVGLSPAEVESVRYAAFLHDLGKVAVPTRIWQKEGALTDAERALIEQHTVVGEDLVRELTVMEAELPIIRSHHERWDGTGYPDGLAGEDIPLGARILAVANVYDALTHERAHRKALRPPEALAQLRRGAGTQFDPRLVEAFDRMMQSEG